MPGAITCDVILSGIRTRADGSIGLTLVTPELQPEEVTAFVGLRNTNLKLLLQPLDGKPTELKDIKQEFETKTPSMRLRACLYRAWEQAGKPGEWEQFYRKKMEFYIEDIKSTLNSE